MPNGAIPSAAKSLAGIDLNYGADCRRRLNFAEWERIYAEMPKVG
jgi:hypothetical protein